MRGWIEEVRGRYRIRVRTADGRKQTLHTADTPERAEEVLAAYRAEVAEAGIADPHALTVRAWGEQWLTRRELDGVRGIHVERVTWATHVLAAPFADWPLETIRPHDVQDWISERLRAKARQGTGRRGESVETDRPISRQTVQHALRLLRQALDDALARELVETNPAKLAKLPKRQAPLEEPWTHLTLDEIERVTSCEAFDDRDRLLFTTAIFTGMRRGELFALRWDDVDLDDARPWLTVRRGVSGATKSGAVRRCPLLPRAHQALREWQGLAGSTSGLVFPSPSGGEYGPGYVAGWDDKIERRNGVERLIRGKRHQAGIDRDVRFHDLRHTCASHLVMGSWGEPWSLEAVREFMGHQSIAMTQRYAHLAPALLLAKAARTTGGAAPRRPTPPRDPHSQHLEIVGAPGTTRTSDLQLRKPLLYPPELRGRGGHR